MSSRAGSDLLPAPSRAVLRWPDGWFRVGQIEQHGVNLLDSSVLHGEEFAHQSIIARGDVLAPHPVFQTEADDRQDDAALGVDDGVATVPEVAAEEPAGVEPFLGGHVCAVADHAGGLQAILETKRIWE